MSRSQVGGEMSETRETEHDCADWNSGGACYICRRPLSVVEQQQEQPPAPEASSTKADEDLLGSAASGIPHDPPSTSKRLEIPMEKCGVCNGQGQVYISRPTCGPSGIEPCTNCQGTGHLLIAGSFTVAFKREDELPPVRFKTDAELHGPERWKADLVLAGWREVRLHVWARPDGALFRGPYGAWCALQGEQNALTGEA